jgi:hypothetical protein
MSKSRRMAIWLVAAAMLLSACSVNTGPLPAVSPLQSSLPTPAVNRTNRPLVEQDYDLKKVILLPDDLKDLFPGTSYSIQQPIGGPTMRGLQATYPTQTLEHTSAFVEGFESRVEIYGDANQAAQAYSQAIAQQRGTVLDIGEQGDASRAVMGEATTLDGQDLDKLEYLVTLRQQNALILLTFRTSNRIAPERLSKAAATVLSRLP